ncbi:MAG: nucleoside hydrolase [Planctomycetaceae bacterium]|nr:nucleoside hydrolase [Planctomycetaceae bacterium]
MPRRVIIDCDPGIDDAVALCMALFDPRFEVVAITATAGNVDARQSSRNVQTIIEMLDPPRWPRLGMGRESSATSSGDRKDLHGADGLGNLGVTISELHHQHPSDKVIADAVRNEPGELTIIALGPLTNIARAISRDPDLTTMIDQIIMTGGSVQGIGNVTPAAECNFYSDPESARAVFHSPITKTLVPLDVTRQLMFPFDLVDRLPHAETRAGKLLHHVVPYAFRAYRQQLGLEGIHLHDAVSLVAALQPELFRTEEMAGDVETQGELTRGATVFDRRPRPDWRINMDVVIDLEVVEVQAVIERGLKYAGQQTA